MSYGMYAPHALSEEAGFVATVPVAVHIDAELSSASARPMVPWFNRHDQHQVC